MKGQDSVPETVHHVVCLVDPRNDSSWKNYRRHLQTDGVHAQDKVPAYTKNEINPFYLPPEYYFRFILLVGYTFFLIGYYTWITGFYL